MQQVTGRTIASVLQNTRARGANPFEAATFGIPDATTVLVSHLATYDAAHHPIEPQAARPDRPAAHPALFIPSGRCTLPLSAAELGVKQGTVPHPHEVI